MRQEQLDAFDFAGANVLCQYGKNGPDDLFDIDVEIARIGCCDMSQENLSLALTSRHFVWLPAFVVNAAH